MAIFFLEQDDARVEPALRRFRDNVLAGNGVTESHRHQVPYQDTHLTAYRFSPDNPRGQIVVFGGYDSYITEWLPMATALRDAGLDTIIFDGPGQGTALDAGVTMTTDWHLPVGAVLDHFRIADTTLLGFSLGGNLVIRAAAFEPRVTRVVAMDVFTDLFECATMGFHATGLSEISSSSHKMPDPLVDAAVLAIQKTDLLTDWVIEQGKRVLGVKTPAELFRAWRRYRTDEVSALLHQDILLMAGADDHYVPLHMMADQIMSLTSARSITARVFTEAESAQNHCQIGNMGLALKVILGWMDQTGGRRAIETPT